MRGRGGCNQGTAAATAERRPPVHYAAVVDDNEVARRELDPHLRLRALDLLAPTKTNQKNVSRAILNRFQPSDVSFFPRIRWVWGGWRTTRLTPAP